MQDEYKTFHVGVNVLVVRSGSLLLGLRIGVFGAGTWGLPGGHLEPRETMLNAAARELMEETGLEVKSLRFSNLVNYPQESKHYIQVGFVAENVVVEPKLLEPDRCERWEWFSLTDLPENMFPPHITQLQNFLHNIPFAESQNASKI